jgi:hypothetical protein
MAVHLTVEISRLVVRILLQGHIGKFYVFDMVSLSGKHKDQAIGFTTGIALHPFGMRLVFI